MEKKTGIELIAQERKEQIEKHGYSVEQDEWHNDNNELIIAAMALLSDDGMRMPSKWNIVSIQKMINKLYKERLIIAGALIAAELDRINSTNP